MPSPARPSSVDMQLAKMQKDHQDGAKTNPPKSSASSMSSPREMVQPLSNMNLASTDDSLLDSHKKNMSEWFSLFADLDPLANPDAIGKSTRESDPNCYS